MANHYHIIIAFPRISLTPGTFVRHVHRELAIRLNELDHTPGRKVMYNFRETRITYQKSYMARLHYVHYVHYNPVKHGIVPIASEYPWCSAAWFEQDAPEALVKSVQSFKIDRLNVDDDF